MMAMAMAMAVSGSSVGGAAARWARLGGAGPLAHLGLSGTVVGALLNHRVDWQALGTAAEAPPYKGRAKAPVLQVKPRNTQVADGARIEVPAGVAALEVGATLGIVIGRTACRVPAAQARGCIGGYTLAADISVPIDPNDPALGAQRHYRPAVRWRCRDGFCPIGPVVVPAAAVAAPDALNIDTAVDGRAAQRAGTSERVRDVATLVAEVSAFMTLHPGDVLLLGAAPGAPLARAGQAVVISMPPVGVLRFSLVEEAPAGGRA
jgi:5-oxopent-3-ene-1,2,5-tricarboxylate decarboxylase/2-hydroxyhepta-2,4-diene-1,7-dioate isomerase